MLKNGPGPRPSQSLPFTHSQEDVGEWHALAHAKPIATSLAMSAIPLRGLKRSPLCVGSCHRTDDRVGRLSVTTSLRRPFWHRCRPIGLTPTAVCEHGNACASITRLLRERSASSGGSTMSAFETIKAAYAAFGRNDPSVLFAAMDSAINWNEAEGTPLAD